jgi:hypothetical protein
MATPTDIDSAIDELDEMEGKSIEELAQIEDPSGQQALDLGMGTKVDASFKGTKPTESLLSIASVSLPMVGQAEDSEQVLTFLVTARVRKQTLSYVRQDDGYSVRAKRTTTVQPVSIQAVSVEQAEHILGA